MPGDPIKTSPRNPLSDEMNSELDQATLQGQADQVVSSLKPGWEAGIHS